MRTNTVTQKVKTPFGSMYIHVEFDRRGRVAGGSISDPHKAPDAQVSRMIEVLSEGLNRALIGVDRQRGNGLE